MGWRPTPRQPRRDKEGDPEVKKAVDVEPYQAARGRISALEGRRVVEGAAVEEYKAKAEELAKELDLGEETLRVVEERAHCNEKILVIVA